MSEMKVSLTGLCTPRSYRKLRAFCAFSLLVIFISCEQTFADEAPKTGAWLIYDLEKGDAGIIDFSGQEGQPRGNREYLGTRKVPYRQASLFLWQDGPTVSILPGPQPWLRGTYENGQIVGEFLDADRGRFTAQFLGQPGAEFDLFGICKEPGVESYECVNVGNGDACGEPLLDGKKTTFSNIASCHLELGKRTKKRFYTLKPSDSALGRDCADAAVSGRGGEKLTVTLKNDSAEAVWFAYLNESGYLQFVRHVRENREYKLTTTRNASYLIYTESLDRCLGQLSFDTVVNEAKHPLSVVLRPAP